MKNFKMVDVIQHLELLRQEKAEKRRINKNVACILNWDFEPDVIENKTHHDKAFMSYNLIPFSFDSIPQEVLNRIPNNKHDDYLCNCGSPIFKKNLILCGSKQTAKLLAIYGANLIEDGVKYTVPINID